MANPILIELARIGSGLTQGSLAHELGTSQPYISQIERGERPIPEDMVQGWAKACDVSAAFLLRSDSPLSDAVAGMVHRRMKTLPTKPFNLANAQVKITSLEIDSLFTEVEVTPALEIPSYPNGTGPADAADALRRAWRISSGPILNLTALVESAGIPIVLLDSFHEKHSGLSHRGRWFEWFIALNINHAASRRRLTLAHELGHIVMGHDQRMAADDNEAALIEAAAFAFAGAFLLPEHDALRELRALTFRRLVDMKQRWKVSIAFLIRRAVDCELIDKFEAARFYMELSSLPGGRRREPAEFEPEEPTLLRKMIDSLHSSGMSNDDISNVMTVADAKFRRVYLNERAYLRPLPQRFPRARVQL